jgi:superfamily II RNA helicase
MRAQEDALLMIDTFTKGIEAGVKHYHPETGELLPTVRDIVETLVKEGTIQIDFGPAGNEIYRGLQ